MEKAESSRYKIKATYKGQNVLFTLEASSSAKAVAEARRLAKDQGMNPIFVNSVRQQDASVIEYGPGYGAPLTALGGECQNVDWGTIFAGNSMSTGIAVLSVDEINAKIATVWDRIVCFKPRPDNPPLKAYELDGRVFLDDGVSGRQELYERSSCELAMLLYDWLTYVGYICDDFGEFVEDYWR